MDQLHVFSSSTNYGCSKYTKFKYLDFDIPFFEINDLKIDNNNEIFKKEGLYFAIRYNANYSILLKDYLGAYFYLKKTYKDIKPIFLNFKNQIYDTSAWSAVPDDLVNLLQAEIIDIDNKSFWFEKVILIDSELPAIPYTVYSEKTTKYDDLSDERLSWWLASTKEIIQNIQPKILNHKHNNYITRSKVNKKYENFKTEWYKARFHDLSFDEKLDEQIKTIGFNVVETLGMGFFEQINITANSKTYSSIEGTGLINALWSDQSTPIISFKVNKKYSGYGFDWNKFFDGFGRKITTINLEDTIPEEACKIIINTLKDFSI